MDTTLSAEMLVKQRNQQELLVAGLAVAVPVTVMFAHKYWLYEYLTDGDLLSLLLLSLGLPLGPCFLWAVGMKKKISRLLGYDYRSNFVGEVRAVLTLNDPKIWALHLKKNKITLACEFFAIAQISLAYAAFVYFA